MPVGGTFRTSPEGAEALLKMLEDGFGARIRRSGNDHVYVEGPAEYRLGVSDSLAGRPKQRHSNQGRGRGHASDQNGLVIRLAVLQALGCISRLLLATPGRANADPAQFDISSQPLPDALRNFAAQAKMQLLYRYDVVRSATANPVAGQLEKHAALEQMLRGTGLEAIYSGADTATIRLISNGQTNAGAPTPPAAIRRARFVQRRPRPRFPASSAGIHPARSGANERRAGAVRGGRRCSGSRDHRHAPVAGQLDDHQARLARHRRCDLARRHRQAARHESRRVAATYYRRVDRSLRR